MNPAQIENNLVQKFAAESTESITSSRCKTHVNDLARRYSQDSVEKPSSHLTSIFDDAVEQQLLVKNLTPDAKSPKK